MYTFHLITKNYKEFNEFVGDSPLGNFRQTSYWGQIKALAGWIPQYFILKKQGIIKGTALVQVRKIPYTPFSLLYCCRGPVVDWNDNASCEAILSALSQVVVKNRGFCMRIDPEPTGDPDQQDRVLLQCGLVKIKTRITQWNRSLYSTRVMLDSSEEHLFQQMRRTHRQNIKTAINKGVTILQKSSHSDKNDFFLLMQGLEKERNSLIHSRDYYDIIYESIVENNVGFFVKAVYENKVIAGLIMVIIKDKSWALFMANNYRYRHLMPNKLLLWEAIKIAKMHGCRFLDLGATQGTEKFDPTHDPLDLLKESYNPKITEFPGYYDIKGFFYNSFRVVENGVFPLLLRNYYAMQRYYKIKAI